ncbi:MAG TPA: glycosyltransferase family 4 protein [Candidatus Sulfotelmatobacter sp.]|nr:glycosyltransferase family 4 protein [Candidatus Sulfotelmatobacter sp.]
MKKILLFTSHDLNARDYGCVLRIRNIARILSRHGEVRVVLGSRFGEVLQIAKPSQAGFELAGKIQFYRDWYSFPGRIRAALKSDYLDIENYQASTSDRERLQAFMAEQDLVWVHGLETANAFGFWRWPTSVVDVDDIPSSVYALRLSQPNSFLQKCKDWTQMILWRRNEKYLRRRFDAICVCSERDREKVGHESVFVLPNGIETPQGIPPRHPVAPPQIGFVGTFVYWANCDAVEWFIRKVWPRILERLPNARLRLAGERGEGMFRGPNVESLGWVRNMEDEMANWSLAIVPVLVGGGTRIKILEAFSRKCPVVSTTLGCYGHDVQNGHDILIADKPDDFAASCLRILEDPAEGERLADNAWAKFSKNSTWDSHAGRIAKVVAKVWGTRVPPIKTDTLSSWKLVPKAIST